MNVRPIAALVLCLLPFGVAAAEGAPQRTDRDPDSIGGENVQPEREDDEHGCLEGRVLDYLQRHGIDGRIDAETQLYVTREHKEMLERERGRRRSENIG